MLLMEVEVPSERNDVGATPPERPGNPSTREVPHEYTHSLPPLLSQLGVSLLVSTYQAGKTAAVGVAAGELTLSYRTTSARSKPIAKHEFAKRVFRPAPSRF